MEDGTGTDSLDRGTEYLLGSSLTVGGAPHTIITGHSGMASQKMFTDLEQLWEGNIFYQYVLDETLAYEVREIHKVLPHDTTYLEIETGEDLCALVTCTPTGVNTHRLLVQGSRIPYVPTKETEEEQSMGKEGAMSESKGKILFEILAVLLLLLGGGAMLSQTFGDSKNTLEIDKSSSLCADNMIQYLHRGDSLWRTKRKQFNLITFAHII